MEDEAPTGRILDDALLRVLARRLGGLTLVERVSVFPAAKPESVIAELNTQYYPEGIRTVAIEIRAYLNGDVQITYREVWGGEGWMVRWDRHENPHSARDHFHHPPDAATEDAVDRDYPTDVLALLDQVLEGVDDRLGTVWESENDTG